MCTNELAVKAKLNDLRNNMDISRIAEVFRATPNTIGNLTHGFF